MKAARPSLYGVKIALAKEQRLTSPCARRLRRPEFWSLMRITWRIVAVLAMGGCGGGGAAPGPGDVADSSFIDDAGDGSTGALPPAAEDGGTATVLDSAAVEWENDAGYVDPG